MRRRRNSNRAADQAFTLLKFSIIALFLGTQFTIDLPFLGRSLVLSNLAMLILIPGLMVYAVKDKDGISGADGYDRTTGYLLFFLAYALLISAIHFSEPFKGTTRFTFNILFDVLFFIIGKNLFSKSPRVERYALFFVYMASVASLYAIVERFMGYNYFLDVLVDFDYSSQFTDNPYRCASTFSNANHFGAMLVLSFPFVFALVKNGRDKRVRSRYTLCGALILIGSYLTLSISTYCGIFLLLFLYSKEWLFGKTRNLSSGMALKLSFSMLMILGFTLYMLFFFNIKSTYETGPVSRFAGPKDTIVSISYRLGQLDPVRDSLSESWGLGLGFKGSMGRGLIYQGSLARIFEQETCDNQYLTFLSDFGVPGLLCWILFYASIVRYCSNVCRASPPGAQREYLRAMVYGVTAAGVIMIGQDLVYFEDAGHIFFLIMGMLLGAARLTKTGTVRTGQRVRAGLPTKKALGWSKPL